MPINFSPFYFLNEEKNQALITRSKDWLRELNDNNPSSNYTIFFLVSCDPREPNRTVLINHRSFVTCFYAKLCIHLFFMLYKHVTRC